MGGNVRIKIAKNLLKMSSTAMDVLYLLMLLNDGNVVKKKFRLLSFIEAEKITFPPKCDIRTDIKTDISNYGVASLLIKTPIKQFLETEKVTLDIGLFSSFIKSGKEGTVYCNSPQSFII